MTEQSSEHRAETQADRVRAVVELMNIPETWDYLLIGDGSGSRWPHACGFACRMYKNITFESKLYFGAFNHGTNILSEMMAYFLPLAEIAADEGRSRQPTGATNVHIITDSDYVATEGNKRIPPRTHRAVWACFEQHRRMGILSTFHWYRRDRLRDNVLSHFLANEARLSMKTGESSVLAVGMSRAAEHLVKLAEEPNASEK